MSLFITLIGLSSMSWSIINIMKVSKVEILEIIPKEIIVPGKIVVSDRSIYEAKPLKGDYIGTIHVPVLGETYPIYEGTSEQELEKGVGHFIKSALPGENNNSVISAHRDTFFRKMYKLKIDDTVIINTKAGEFTYIVIGIKIVKKTDRTVIVPIKDSILTMTTCYPFDYVGRTSNRYIISAKLVETI